MLMLLCGQLMMAQQQIDPRLRLKDKRAIPSSSIRQIAATFNATNFYVAGMTMDLTFSLELTNTDLEYGDSLSITFPTGITPNSSPTNPIYVATEGQPDEVLNGVFGQTVSWGDNDNNYGGIEPGVVIPFTVNVTVDPSLMGTQTISFFVSGDEFGPNPGDQSGTFTIDALPNTPVGVLTPNVPFLALTEIGSPIPSNNYALVNIGGADLMITGTSYATNSMAFTDNLMGMTVMPGDSLIFAITYDPMAPGNDIDTFVVSTNDGDFSIPLTGYAYGNGTALEGFESAVFPSCQWTTIDADGDGFGWTAAALPLEGSISAISASYDNPSQSALTPDNYLVSPQITPDATNNFLSYFVSAVDANFAAEFYEVYVSTTGNSPGDFTTSLFSETLSTTQWEERFIDLSAYAGQNIYIAFRHYNVTDQFLMRIDAIRLPPQTIPNSALPPLDVTLIGAGINCPGGQTGILQVGLTGGGSSYAYLFPGVDTVVSGMTNVSVGGNLPEGDYTVNVIDNCGNDVVDSVSIAATGVNDDASFVYPWTTLCKLDSMNIGPQITGLAGGTFSGTAGLVFESTATGKIDVLATPVGTYGVVYTTNGPCPSSDTVIITVDAMCTTTSVEDFASASLELYPNPNQGQFTLQNTGIGRDAEIEILNLQGQTLYRKQTYLSSKQQLEINLGDVAAGMYMVKITSGNQVAVDRLVIR